jgi:hypothetical protein
VQVLSLNACRQLTDTSLLHIGRSLPELQALDLRGCQVTDAGMHELTGLPLQRVALPSTVSNSMVCLLGRVACGCAFVELASTAGLKETHLPVWHGPGCTSWKPALEPLQ